MTPVVLNLTIFQGVAFAPAPVIHRDSAGTAVSLTGYTAEAQARSDPCAGPAFALAPVISAPATGEITLAAMTAAETAALPCGRYGWDLILIDGSGQRTGPAFAGRIAVSPLHTQPA